MQVKTLVSIIALGTALAFAGPAAAQTINGAAISADDLPKVQARCDELATASSTESLAENADDNSGETTDDTADATITNAPQANGADVSTVSSVDLDTLTLESCTTSGLVTGN